MSVNLPPIPPDKIQEGHPWREWFLKLQKAVASGSGGGGGSGVSQIVAGSNVTINPVGGTGVVTINAVGGGSSLNPLIAASLRM